MLVSIVHQYKISMIENRASARDNTNMASNPANIIRDRLGFGLWRQSHEIPVCLVSWVRVRHILAGAITHFHTDLMFLVLYGELRSPRPTRGF